MKLKGKLERMKGHMQLGKEITPSLDEGHSFVQAEHDKRSSSPTKEIPFLEKWRSLNAEPFFFEDQYCLVREVRYKLEDRHGHYQFKEFCSIHQRWQQSSVNHPLSAKGYSLSELFFFDTETTGLGGGVGNTIFLLGHARVSGDQVILRQHFLPSPGCEVALYQSFLSEVDYQKLVTYNGKSFDWPQVKTRHTLIRETVPQLPEFGHFDLYHASRRLFKHKLESVRLKNVEEEYLSVQRENDVPGYLAPILYFNFLEIQDPDVIAGVLEHNEKDILSLITLYIHLSQLILGEKEASDQGQQYELGRWLHLFGEQEMAISLLKEAGIGNDEEHTKAKATLAMIYKREKRMELALALWKEIVLTTDRKLQIEAATELAKYYEHMEKNYKEAHGYAEKILELSDSANDKEYHSAIKRLTRIRKKMA